MRPTAPTAMPMISAPRRCEKPVPNVLAKAAMGKELENKGEGVYGVEFPRSDLAVTSEGVTLDPGMELAPRRRISRTRATAGR